MGVHSPSVIIRYHVTDGPGALITAAPASAAIHGRPNLVCLCKQGTASRSGEDFLFPSVGMHIDEAMQSCSMEVMGLTVHESPTSLLQAVDGKKSARHAMCDYRLYSSGQCTTNCDRFAQRDDDDDATDRLGKAKAFGGLARSCRHDLQKWGD